VIFREFIGFEPEWRIAPPDVDAMLSESDAALLIGDPALAINDGEGLRKFDLAELWRGYTGLGFVFAMWMTTRESCSIDFAAARDEGLRHIPEIAANYAPQTGLPVSALAEYLSSNISYSIDHSMQRGLELYLDLAHRHRLTEMKPELRLI
jgi:chorismate dehydratase